MNTEIKMKKIKYAVISGLSVLILGYTMNQTQALNKKEAPTTADREVNSVIKKEDLEEKPSEPVKEIKDDKKKEDSVEDIEVEVEEVKEVKEVVKEPVKEEVIKETKPVVKKEIKETYDYIWSKESFGSIKETTIEDSSKDKGYRNVQEGNLGQKEIQIKITYQNGVEVSRRSTGEEKIISNPIDTKIVIGTKVQAVQDSNYLRSDATEIFNQINIYRTSKGLSKFERSQQLNSYADVRSKEITDVFAHTRPNGQAWHTAGSGILAENLAYGYSPKGTVDAWINSTSGHNEVLLKNNRYAGVSVYLGADGSEYAVLLTGN